MYTCATIVLGLLEACLMLSKYTKIFNFYDLSLECEGPLLTGHIHPSLFGSQGLNDHVWLALTQKFFLPITNLSFLTLKTQKMNPISHYLV